MFTLLFSLIIIVLGIMQFSISIFFTDNQIKKFYIVGECYDIKKQIKIIRGFFIFSGLSLALSGTLWGLSIISDFIIIIILIVFFIALHIVTHTHKDNKSIDC